MSRLIHRSNPLPWRISLISSGKRGNSVKGVRRYFSSCGQSQSRIQNFTSIAASKNRRFLSAGSDKVEEAETVYIPPPPTERVLNCCWCSLEMDLLVSRLQGSFKSWFDRRKPQPDRPSIRESWAQSVIWHPGNLFSIDSWKDVLKGVTSIISCISGFGSKMNKINGTANINAIGAASKAGVQRFVYISVADFGVENYLLQGYFKGKRDAEDELSYWYPHRGVILRPGFIHGTRRVGPVKLPLGVIGSPLESVLKHAKPLAQVPLLGPLLTPPVNVKALAKVAVRAATDPVFPSGIVEAHEILRYSRQR